MLEPTPSNIDDDLRGRGRIEGGSGTLGELPSYAALRGIPGGAFYALLAEQAEPVLNANYDHAWERDHALLKAIDSALKVAASSRPSGAAPKPRWLRGLVTRELRTASTSFWSRERFARIRLIERLDLITLEPDDTYVLAMVSALGPNKADTLRADPDLVERALWRTFEVEGGGEVSLRNVDRFAGDEWRQAFLELTRDGTLDRSRVLAECLQALNRDFAAYRAAWFSATFLALEPTTDELAGFQGNLCRLLGAPVPATVAFAVKHLARVHKAGRLDIAATLAALPDAALVRTKGTALEALRLARALRGEDGTAAAQVARTALGHPDADVQRAAASLLSDSGGGDDLAASAGDFTPSVQRDLGLGGGAHESDRRAGEAGRIVQPLAAPPPRARGSEVVERTAALLEDASDAAELEAVLAALIAPEVGRLLAPLTKRARAIVARGPRTELGDAWLPGQVARLVLTIVGEPAAPAVPDRPAQRFVVRRLDELRDSSAPLLATPDLPGGWVSPAALVERLGQNPSPRHHDLIAALLRLHPEGRSEVSETAILPAAVQFALTGAEPSRRLFRVRRDGPAAWWTAAARSQAPYAGSDLPQLTGEVRTHAWQESGRERRSSYAKFMLSPPVSRTAPDDQPTELAAKTWNQRERAGTNGNLGDWIPTLASIWPHDAEHFLALSCRPVLESPNWTETAHDVPRTLDALARHPGRLGSLAAYTLAAGLSAAARDHRLHAVDAFLDLVATGRIPPEDVAAPLAQYAPAWPATRWAESLASAAQGPGGPQAVVGLLTALLPDLASDHRGLNKLLELLRDQSIRLGVGVTDPSLVRWLHQYTGGSASARTARLLLG